MKKSLFATALIAVVGLLAISCSSTNLETNQVGWSAYSDIVAKDFDAVKIVKLSSTETITTDPFYLNKKTEGSRVLYSQLMDEAAKVGADDIINVRIDRKLETARRPIIQFLIGKKTVYTYTATAVAIKYKDTKPGSILGKSKTNSVSEAGPDSPAALLSKILKK